MRFVSFFRIIRRRRRRKAVGVSAYRKRKEEARDLVHARLAHWRNVHPFEHGSVRIKNQRRAWGSCSSKRNLNFNWRLVVLPLELADYVILHELCHTVHFNHSEQFWALLISLAPDAMESRERLRKVPLERLGAAAS